MYQKDNQDWLQPPEEGLDKGTSAVEVRACFQKHAHLPHMGAPSFATANAVVHCKIMETIFPSPAGMSLTKFSLARNN